MISGCPKADRCECCGSDVYLQVGVRPVDQGRHACVTLCWRCLQQGRTLEGMFGREWTYRRVRAHETGHIGPPPHNLVVLPRSEGPPAAPRNRTPERPRRRRPFALVAVALAACIALVALAVFLVALFLVELFDTSRSSGVGPPVNGAIAGEPRLVGAGLSKHD